MHNKNLFYVNYHKEKNQKDCFESFQIDLFKYYFLEYVIKFIINIYILK